MGNGIRMITHFSLNEIDEVVRIQGRHGPPNGRAIAMILGSGLNDLADSIRRAGRDPVCRVAAFSGFHSGRAFGTDCHRELEGQSVYVMQGRIHFYEGYSMAQVTLPVRVMQRFGIEMLIVTNAAGGVNPAFIPGDVMLITDHMNFLGMMGQNPLMGPNYDEIGPRFPDMSRAYDPALCDLARDGCQTREHHIYGKASTQALAVHRLKVRPTCKFLRLAGADTVGMSTVPEVTVARHGGMRVLGFSGVSNKANLDGSTVTTHEEVIEAGKVITPKIEKLIRGVLHEPISGSMAAIYRFLSTYEVLIYILLAIGGLFAFRWLWRSWNEWRQAVYSLEREFALRRMGAGDCFRDPDPDPLLRRTDHGFHYRSQPAGLIFHPHATLDLLATPTGTISAELATQIALTPRPVPTIAGGEGCQPDKLMLSSPKAGTEIHGTVDIQGTVNIPNLGFYKYEVAPLNSDTWSTISAGRRSGRRRFAWAVGYHGLARQAIIDCVWSQPIIRDNPYRPAYHSAVRRDAPQS